MSLDIVLSHGLTAAQRVFVDRLAEGCDKSEAIIKAGYKDEKPEREAWRLLQQPQILAALQIQVARRLAVGAAVARKVLHDIMVDESVDKRLRAACAKDLLNRAGFIAPKAQEARKGAETPLNEMSTTELRALADKLEGEIAGRAKEVSSAKVAPRATQAIEDII